MRRYILLIVILLLTGTAMVLAGNPSNNYLLAGDCFLATEKLTPLWKVNLTGNAIFAPFATNNGTLVFSTDKAVGVVNSNTGQLNWQLKLDNGCKWNSVLSSNNSVCAFGLDEINSLSTQDGSSLWSRKLEDNITAQPISDGERIYLVTGKTVFAFDSSRGAKVWDRTLKGAVTVSPCVSNGLVVFATLDGYCAALDVRDGAIEWESKPGEQPTDSLVSYAKNIYLVCEKSLFALDSATGKPIWKFVARSNGFSPTATDDALLYPTMDKTLYCLDPKTCGKGCCLATPKQLWQVNRSSMLPRRIESSGKNAYLTTSDGWVQVVDIQKGDLVSKHEIGLDMKNSILLPSSQVVVPYGSSLASYASLPSQVEVFVDKPFVNRDKFQISVGAGAKIVNGKSMLPAFIVLEPFGGTAAWDSKTKTMTCMFEGRKLEAKLNSNMVAIDGNQTKLDANTKVVPVIIKGRVMLPARFLVQTFMNFGFVWNESKKSFTVGRGVK